ncbi:MAG: secretion system protein [Anaerolineae bacterium]|jgi:tight adherence protein B|nr:secretion system protein [Anaerolineae bacterium]MBT7325469.1 secretion system protein [Anaerolineae bacterium]
MGLDTTTWFFIIAAVFVFVLLIVGVVMSSNSERNLVENRLGRYLEEDAEHGKEDATSYLTEWVNRRAEKSPRGDRLKKSLARADLKFTVAEYYGLIVISTAAGATLAGLIGSFDPISLGIGGILGFFAPNMYVKRQQKKRLKKFDDQLPDMINLMVNGLRAGYSTMQAMESISKELPPPISDEFRRVVQEMQLGVPMDRALDNLLRRIPSPDLDFMITAINVQREVGGNLAEILDTISFTIRERIRIKGEINTLTSQVRTSASILSLLPILLALFLWFVNNDYMKTIFDNGLACGFGALGAALFLIILGYFIMMRIADIEV